MNLLCALFTVEEFRIAIDASVPGGDPEPAPDKTPASQSQEVTPVSRRCICNLSSMQNEGQ